RTTLSPPSGSLTKQTASSPSGLPANRSGSWISSSTSTLDEAVDGFGSHWKLATPSALVGQARGASSLAPPTPVQVAAWAGSVSGSNHSNVAPPSIVGVTVKSHPTRDWYCAESADWASLRIESDGEHSWLTTLRRNVARSSNSVTRATSTSLMLST